MAEKEDGECSQSEPRDVFVASSQVVNSKSKRYTALKEFATSFVTSPKIQAFNSILVFLTCVDYVGTTYIDDKCADFRIIRNSCPDDSKNRILLLTLAAAECFFSLAFFIDYVMTGIYFPSIRSYAASSMGIIDLISILPILRYAPHGIVAISYCCMCLSFFFFETLIFEAYMTFSKHGKVRSHALYAPTTFMVVFAVAAALLFDSKTLHLHFLSILKCFKAARILRLHRMMQAKVNEIDELPHEIMVLLLKIIGIVFVTTGVIQEISSVDNDAFSSGTELSWASAFYFVIITMSTVGYGDYYPYKGYAKLMMVVFVLVCFVYIPEQVGKIQEIRQTQRLHRHPYIPSRPPPPCVRARSCLGHHCEKFHLWCRRVVSAQSNYDRQYPNKCDLAQRSTLQ